MANEIHIGQLIENRRKELNISKVELAKRVGTSRENVMMITYRKNRLMNFKSRRRNSKKSLGRKTLPSRC